MQKHDAWIKKACSDLKLAKKGLDDFEVWDAAIYHTQQCAEKSLKGYLVFIEKFPQKTHDLVSILEHCILTDKNFKTLLSSTEVLNPYATAFRYPDDRGTEPDLELLKEAINHASKILNAVKEKIKEMEIGQSNIFKTIK